jgi:hypothetical protein
MFCTIRAPGLGLCRTRTARAGLLALAAVFASGSGAFAQQQQDSLLKQAFKLFGFATDVGPPANFVSKTRPKGDLDYIPVFTPPPEPSRPALKAPDLKSVKSDLDGIEKRDDAIRRAFPPAAKALAEERAGQKKPGSTASGTQQ